MLRLVIASTCLPQPKSCLVLIYSFPILNASYVHSMNTPGFLTVKWIIVVVLNIFHPRPLYTREATLCYYYYYYELHGLPCINRIFVFRARSFVKNHVTRPLLQLKTDLFFFRVSDTACARVCFMQSINKPRIPLFRYWCAYLISTFARVGQWYHCSRR